MTKKRFIFPPCFMKKTWSLRDLLWWIAFRAYPIDVDETNLLNLIVSLRPKRKKRNIDTGKISTEYETRPQFQDFCHLLSICVNGPNVFEDDIYKDLKNYEDIYSKLHHEYEPMVRRAYHKLHSYLTSGEIVFMVVNASCDLGVGKLEKNYWDTCQPLFRGIDISLPLHDFDGDIFLDLHDTKQEEKIFEAFPEPEGWLPPEGLLLRGSSMVLSSEIDENAPYLTIYAETRGRKPSYSRDEIREIIAELIYKAKGKLPSEAAIFGEVCDRFDDRYKREPSLSTVQDILKPFKKAEKKYLAEKKT